MLLVQEDPCYTECTNVLCGAFSVAMGNAVACGRKRDEGITRQEI